MDDIRGTPLGVGTLEEMIDDTHAIVSSSNGPEMYVTVMSFVNQDLLEPGCTVLLHHKVFFLKINIFSLRRIYLFIVKLIFTLFSSLFYFQYL